MKYADIKQVEGDIFLVRFHSFEPTDAQFEDYLIEMGHIYDYHENTIMIIDGTEAKYLPSKLRIRQGKWIADNEEILRKRCKAHIYVIPNPIVSFILKGIFIVKKPPVSYKVVKTYDEAFTIAKTYEEIPIESL